ncbi:PAQR family membrane homeostasis protein TrhA [Frigidibacter sp. ROC022]|uniref:PAQR family membrane homeostasis protein TrhA n=1 Tax=Frigidibacter sp. ROC022 TaxID=2971796 RepID=UPI00215B1138|nr:hemolysin III family protein [Frigidibacter sp. ROC022]MCR8724289.1 hemolysin III family protein [Frigidibacter sp. ROC022]
MTQLRLQRTSYSRAELISDAVVHGVGLAFVLVAVPVLITMTALMRGDAASVVGISVYGASFIAMILFSGLYNVLQIPRWKGFLQRLDHSAIYLKIAGTYTPFTLLSGHGGLLTAALWGCAALGSGLKMIDPARFRWIGLALYLGMGWAGVFAGQAMFASLPTPVMVLIAIGGGIYTLGIVAYLWTRLPHHNTIWHVFVLVASLVFYAAVTVQVVGGPVPG